MGTEGIIAGQDGILLNIAKEVLNARIEFQPLENSFAYLEVDQ